MQKKSKHYIIKLLLFVVVALVCFTYTIKWLDKMNVNVGEKNVSSLIRNSNSMSEKSLVDDFVEFVIGLDLLNPIEMLSNNYGGLVNYELKSDKLAFNSNVTSSYMVNKSDLKVNNVAYGKPLVYIYNTHQGEKYKSDGDEIYTVMNSSNMLHGNLNKYGISSIVENTSIQNILNVNNWNYASSYKVTKMLIEQAKIDYPSVEYFIDVHRDSVNRNITTVTIGDKGYARIMFLVGLDNPNYKKNLEVMTNMNNILERDYPGISRGIYKKSGMGVDGVYNQDISGNCILIEVGGEQNNIVEVTNTIEAFASMFNEYIGGNNES